MNTGFSQQFLKESAMLYILCFFFSLFLFDNVLAEEKFWLKVSSAGFGGSECITDQGQRGYAYMIGMTGEFVVSVEYSDSIKLTYRGVQDWSWPQGLSIEAALSDDIITTGFTPSEAILNRLNLRYYVDMNQARRDSLWRTEGINVYDQIDIQPRFWFLLDLADEWNGKYLCLRAHYNNPLYGNLTSGVRCFKVSAPCSKADTALMHLGNIAYAGYARDYERALHLTDSLLTTGWTDRIALRYAREFAGRSNKYDNTLRYIDIQFQRYGNIGFSGGEEVHQITPESRAQYEETRQRIIRRKAEYEQQQQQQR